jgi:hypothetical protein
VFASAFVVSAVLRGNMELQDRIGDDDPVKSARGRILMLLSL